MVRELICGLPCRETVDEARELQQQEGRAIEHHHRRGVEDVDKDGLSALGWDALLKAAIVSVDLNDGWTSAVHNNGALSEKTS